MKILVVGASGLIGSTMLRVINEREGMEAFGTVRRDDVKKHFAASIANRLIVNVCGEHDDFLMRTLERLRPDVVINCAGVTKHRRESEDPLAALPINSLMPHRLAGYCSLSGARLIHISSDCVFRGDKEGGYTEEDVPDAQDLYGRSKALGEVIYPNAITLRTSTIGHELASQYGLLNWFLSCERQCKGYRRAVFSGLPTVVLAQVVRDIVIPLPKMSGLFHVAAEPINKFELLRLIADVYGKSIGITPDDTLVVDRSLRATKFQLATGYIPPPWRNLIEIMHSYG